MGDGDRQQPGDGRRMAIGPLAPEHLETKPDVDAVAFGALDLRIGVVVEVLEFPEARPAAWKLRVDFGPVLGTLGTSARIANYDAQDLLGRRIVGAVNLGMRRIAGFDSQFLVLGGLEPDGTVHLLAVDGELAPGSVVA